MAITKALAGSFLSALIGLLIIVGALSYDLGSWSNMGPGFFPLLLGGGLACIGITSAVIEFKNTDKKDSELLFSKGWEKRIRTWVAVVLGMLIFMIFCTRFGMMPATFFAVLVGAMGDRRNRWWESILLATGSMLFAVILFGWIMEMQMPLLKWLN